MDSTLLIYAAIGFAAQMIDGSIGMAYGLVSTSSLVAAGVPPANASAAVHLAEIFTTGASGYSHWRLGNVNRALLRRLAIPGVAGGFIGAAMVSVAPVEIIKIAVNIYLFIMGVAVLLRAFELRPRVADHRHIGPLGFFGGMVDAFGGGWGPVVSSTLIMKGHEPRRTVGTVNVTEFLVTAAQSAVFVAFLGLVHLDIVAALVVGGVIAAPIAARLTLRLPIRTLIFLVGALVAGLSARSLYLAL
jgi:uncharacterized membrane protein YfcA